MKYPRIKNSYKFIFALAILALMILIAVFIIDTKKVAKAQNQIKIFPTSYNIESSNGIIWQNPENAFNQDLPDNASFSAFNEENSAFIKGIIEGQTTTTTVPSETTPTTESTTTTTLPSETTTTITEQPTTTTESTTTTTIESTTTTTTLPQEETTTTTNPPSETTTTTEPISFLKELFQFLTPKAKAEETTTTTEPTTTTETTSTTLPSETTTITEPTTITPVTSSLIFSNFDLGKDFFNQTIPQNIQLRFSLAGQGQEGDKVIISYFYGEQWQNLEALDLSSEVSNNKNGGYFLYALPVFENWADLENLKIRFTHMCDEAQNSCGLVFLDAVWLEVEYQSGEEKEIAFVDPRTNFSSDEEPEFILPLITERDNNTLLDKIRELLFQPQIQIKEVILIGPDNQKITAELILNKENESYKIRIKKPENFQSGKYFFEIQFEWADQIYTAKTEFNWEEIIIFNPVLSPDFLNSATKQDVEENGIRVVIIERGGLMELWYAIPDKDKPEAMNWFFLAGHSQIDNDSPLGLKGKTIFWLDKNEQTIFGYAIDEQSIFGKSVETERKESYLEFQNKNLGSWRAVFDPINNKFNFLKSLGENQ